jgi:type VI secretion system protein ImpF
MAELTPQERLQPSLLDRLTDDEPDRKHEPKENRVLSLRQLKESVLRDLSSLLNTCSFQTTEDVEPYPLVARSVLNYGVRSLAGSHITSADKAEVERNIRKAIEDFEPRILRDSISVEVILPKEQSPNAMNIRIEGNLWAQPLPVHLYLWTEVECEDGRVSVTESTGSEG